MSVPLPPIVLYLQYFLSVQEDFLGMCRHSFLNFPSLLLLRLLFLLPVLLFVFRPSSDHSSTSSSSTPATADEFASPLFFANALPISMLNSMTRFYPMNSLINGRTIAEQHKSAQFIKEKKERKEEPSSNFGRLKLCPPGGRSFFEAFELACPMKRRRRKRHAFGFGRAPALAFGRRMFVEYDDVGGDGDKSIAEGDEKVQQRRKSYRPANITELMQICCAKGCEFVDLLPHCGPFSMW